jgi:hypothetical protein
MPRLPARLRPVGDVDYAPEGRAYSSERGKKLKKLNRLQRKKNPLWVKCLYQVDLRLIYQHMDANLVIRASLKLV